MRRKDIKRGTTIILAFTVVAVIAIIVAGIIRFTKYYREKTDTTAVAAVTTVADPLRNSDSDCDALIPLERDVERFMSKWDIRGLSLAVVRNDSLLFTKGFGLADSGTGEKMEANTISRIASASKLVTAVAVMKLVEEGKLSLDRKVFGDGGLLESENLDPYIRDLRIYDITVEHLLRHRAGFTRGMGDPMFTTADIIRSNSLDKVPSAKELMKIVIGRRLGYQPGSGSRYSNFGYLLLSLIIEEVTGKSYWDYVRENVLLPAGVISFSPATNYVSERGENESCYYSPDDELVEEFNGSGKMVDRCYGGADINGLMGAGGWCASSASLARLVAAIDGETGVPDILSGESIAMMTSHDEDEKTCFGWSDSDGKGKWTRSGTLSSAHAIVERFPDNEIWVILTNTGVWTGFRFTRDLQRLIDMLRSRYSGCFPVRDLW